MPRRPPAIIVIAVCYLIAPLAIVVFTSAVSGVPFGGRGGFFPSLRPAGLLILVLYPASAVALLSMKRWGWYLFLGCAAALISHAAGSYAVSARLDLFAVVLAGIVLTTAAGIVFHTHVIAPYYNPRVRWWETEPAYRVEAYAQVIVGEAVVSGEILDLSRNGCFATFILDLAVGKTYPMRLRCLKHTLDVEGRIMRKSAKCEPNEGYGIMFTKMSADQREKLDGIIAELERGGLRDFIRDQEMIPSGITNKNLYEGVTEMMPRYTIASKVSLSDNGRAHVCRLIDISRNGCFVASAEHFVEGALFKVKIDCLKTRLNLDGRIERKDTHEGENGYRVKFTNMTRRQKKDLQSLLFVLKRIGADYKKV